MMGWSATDCSRFAAAGLRSDDADCQHAGGTVQPDLQRQTLGNRVVGVCQLREHGLADLLGQTLIRGHAQRHGMHQRQVAFHEFGKRIVVRPGGELFEQMAV